MSDLDKKIIKMVSVVTEKTYRKDVVWRLVDAPEKIVQGSSFYVGNMYSAIINKRNFVIYESKQEEYSIYVEKFYWHTNLVLAVADVDNVPIHTVCSGRSILNDLYTAVTSQVSDVDNLINDIIEDDFSDL
ncbi:hypothetical protein [Vreelandella titanicae]|uniref:Uncharacterized protein n=1 Tax=Vreelandella titanicae TaxID=664683 RepID=A0AAP9NQE1_9GAMM|nr:hypothetical protein [Halomonas titanicae]QKS26563.1 hypothetical protein FX987_04372 [Halomonas titanicae]